MKTMTVSMVCQIENVYFPAGSIHADFKEKVAEEAATYCKELDGADILQRMRKDGNHVSICLRPCVRGLGLDTTSLVQAREYKETGTETQGAEGERGGKSAEWEEQHQWLLNEQKRKFLDGETDPGRNVP